MTWWKRLPFFYGWIIVAVGFVCLGVGYSTWLSYSIFYVAILDDFGWSRAATAATFSIFTIVNGFSAMGAGGLVDRLGPRRVLPLGALVIAVGLLLTTRITEIWQYYLSFGLVVAVGLSGLGMVPNLTLVNNWFVRRRGTAVGWTTAGLGVGVLVLVPALQAVITSSGWRTAYLVLATIIVVLVPGLSIAFHRHRPQDLGLLPDGEMPGRKRTTVSIARPRGGAPAVDRKWAATDWTLASAVRTGRFWLVFLARYLELAVMNLFLAHQVAFLVDAGYDRLLAASAVGLFGIVGSCAQVVWGLVSDRIGREKALAIVFAIGTTVALIALSVNAHSPTWLPYLYGVFFGVYWAASAVVFPALSADIFHGRRFGSIFGGLYVGGGFGAATGAFLGGYVFDLTRSYTMAFACAIPTMWLSFLLYWLAAPRKVRTVEGKAQSFGSP